MLDETDVLEQSDDVRVAANATQSERKKRGIERKSTSNLDYRHHFIITICVFSAGFIDALAREYSNACNGVLRTSAVVYQQVVLGIGSGSGEEGGSSGSGEF